MVMNSRRKQRARFLAELEPALDGLHRTALRLTRDPTRAEDVLQDAVLKAYRFFGSFREGTNFRAWMHRVLYTVFVNSIRSSTPGHSHLEAVPELQSASASLSDELDQPTHVQRARAVLDAVDEKIKHAVLELPQELRMVFMLSTVEELKYREIAEIMDCPVGTVMSRLFRSRRMLQERLTDYAEKRGFEGEPDSRGADAPAPGEHR